MKTYNDFKEVPENLFTKTQLKSKDLKLAPDAEVVATVKYKMQGEVHYLNLYDINKCLPIKKYKKK